MFVGQLVRYPVNLHDVCLVLLLVQFLDVVDLLLLDGD